MPKLIHYRDKCIGCYGCVNYAPDYWDMDEEDGKANLTRGKQKKDVFQQDIFEEEIERNKMAALACPMHIIKIQSDDGRDITND